MSSTPVKRQKYDYKFEKIIIKKKKKNKISYIEYLKRHGLILAILNIYIKFMKICLSLFKCNSTFANQLFFFFFFFFFFSRPASIICFVSRWWLWIIHSSPLARKGRKQGGSWLLALCEPELHLNLGL
jgi:hypothetical protein